MTNIHNSKQLAFDPPQTDSDILIWGIFEPILGLRWCLQSSISGLSGLGGLWAHFTTDKRELTIDIQYSSNK